MEVFATRASPVQGSIWAAGRSRRRRADLDASAGDVDWVMNEQRLKLEVGHVRG